MKIQNIGVNNYNYTRKQPGFKANAFSIIDFSNTKIDTQNQKVLEDVLGHALKLFMDKINMNKLIKQEGDLLDKFVFTSDNPNKFFLIAVDKTAKSTQSKGINGIEDAKKIKDLLGDLTTKNVSLNPKDVETFYNSTAMRGLFYGFKKAEAKTLLKSWQPLETVDIADIN